MKTYSKEDYIISHKTPEYYLIRLKGKKGVGLSKVDREQFKKD